MDLDIAAWTPGSRKHNRIDNYPQDFSLVQLPSLELWRGIKHTHEPSLHGGFVTLGRRVDALAAAARVANPDNQTCAVRCTRACLLDDRHVDPYVFGSSSV
jgi:hypothetical protein